MFKKILDKLPKKMTPQQITQQRLQEQVQTALADDTPLYVHGGNSKAFYGNKVNTQYSLDVSEHTGIVEYAPSELCVTVCAGTRIIDLEEELASKQQILPFEPPAFNESATIGGAIAAGLSGPRRPYSGSVRDAILGVKIINGSGEIISFGGQVMKNVAGYDVSRLMTGSLGTLGVILEVSLKVIPKPAVDSTIMIPFSHEEAITYFTSLRTSGLPVSASCYVDDQVYIRLSGSKNHIESILKKQDWQHHENGYDFWQSIRNQTHSFFQQHNKPLWRLSVSPTSPASVQLNTDNLIEWGGAIRWSASNTPANIVKSIANKKGGSAILFRGDIPEVQTFPTLDPALFAIHKRLKRKLDPKGIFNPDRMYKGL
ncbi:MAG: glycolate oxidase subunit GlcE [Thiotrichaceae bacterium]